MLRTLAQFMLFRVAARQTVISVATTIRLQGTLVSIPGPWKRGNEAGTMRCRVRVLQRQDASS